MTNYDTRVQALKVYLPGVLVSARKPTLPNAYVYCLTMHFDTVRRVNKYVYASRRDRIGKDGKPIEIQIPAPLIKYDRGRKFLSRNTHYLEGMYQVYGTAISSCLPLMR